MSQQSQREFGQVSASNQINYVVAGGLILFGIFSVMAVSAHHWKVLAISWIAFISMGTAIPLGVYGARQNKFYNLLISYGIASGAMITSTALFLIPAAIKYDAVAGGLGIAAGVIGGFAIHTVSHNASAGLWNIDSVILELVAHALTAGIIIGAVYAVRPGFSILLGVAIISHKAPAGYAAAQKLAGEKGMPRLLLLPACAVGLTALPVSLLSLPVYGWVNALVFGFATGVFFHVAVSFLPNGPTAHQNYQPIAKNNDNEKSNGRAFLAIFSVFLGGLIVYLLWYLTH